MSINIISFIKNLLPSFSKSDMLTDMETSIDYIDNVFEGYISLEGTLKVVDIKSKKAKELIKDFYKNLKLPKSKVKLTNNDNFPTDMITLFKNVKINGDYLAHELDDAINDVVVSNALTAYKAFMLRSVGHYYYMTKFATDVLNYIYVHESLEINKNLGKGYKLIKKQEELIVKNMWIFARLLSLYGLDNNTFKDNLGKIENITLPKDDVEDAVNMYGSNNIDPFNNLPTSFIGSPIYSIRLVFAQWEADRFKELKDKKKLLELRHLHYQLLKENGDGDINTEKEIEYLQKRIDDIQYKLAKMSEDLDD